METIDNLKNFPVLFVSDAVPTQLDPADTLLSEALFGLRRFALAAAEMYSARDPRRNISFVHTGRGLAAFASVMDDEVIHLVWLSRGVNSPTQNRADKLARLARRMGLPGRLGPDLPPMSAFTDLLTNVAAGLHMADVVRPLLKQQGFSTSPLLVDTPLGRYTAPGLHRVEIIARPAA